MTASMDEKIKRKVQSIETLPSMPAIFLPLLDLLNGPPELVNVDEIVRLISYDNTIAAQCLRVVASPLFGLAKPPGSIRGAVVGLGLQRVQTILLTCCLGRALPAKKSVLDVTVFWKHSLGCAMVCRKFSEKLAKADKEKAYMAGLLHDIGFMANSLAFPEEFSKAFEHARLDQISLEEAERSLMGFTHCETGRLLAERWWLPEDVVQVIAHHHHPESSDRSQPLVALVHLSDLLCRVRGMGYGYYERQRVDLLEDPAWGTLMQEHHELAGVDLFRFTLELDEAVSEVCELVDTVVGTASASASARA